MDSSRQAASVMLCLALAAGLALVQVFYNGCYRNEGRNRRNGHAARSSRRCWLAEVNSLLLGAESLIAHQQGKGLHDNAEVH